jgi:poly(3-hydroxybutyrate) depolymerase
MFKPFFSASLAAGAFLLLSQMAFAVELPKLSPDPKDPQYQKKGEFDRTYTFPGTDEKIPYHLYVPSKWNKSTKLPLVIVLHGGGQTAEKPFEHGNGILAKVAEQRQYILAGVLGYRNYAGYGNPFRIVQVAPAAGAQQGKGKTGAPAAKKGGNSPEERQRSEQDVLNVLALVQKEYNTDPTRTYLMGNLMGSGGTWYLGEKYPELWAAISPSNGPVEAENYPFDRLKTVPTVVVHGDPNTGTSGEAALKLVNGAQQHGVEVLWLQVPGADHLEAWTHVVPMVFEFFAQHQKKQ